MRKGHRLFIGLWIHGGPHLLSLGITAYEVGICVGIGGDGEMS